MGYAFCIGSCFCCNKVFGFNPMSVPSYKNEPLCESCVTEVNAVRIEKGLEPFPIAENAYQPVDENELP